MIIIIRKKFTDSDNICQLLSVTLDASFLALSELLTILVSLHFLTFSICLPKFALFINLHRSAPNLSLFIEHSVLFSLSKTI